MSVSDDIYIYIPVIDNVPNECQIQDLTVYEKIIIKALML